MIQPIFFTSHNNTATISKCSTKSIISKGNDQSNKKSHKKHKNDKKTATKDDKGAKTVKSINKLSLQFQQALISPMIKMSKKN